MKPSALFALAFLVPAAPLVAQEAQPSGPVVELPKFVVTDNRELPQPESWRYATIPGFEILTNASNKATQRLVRDFEMFRQALGYVWPVPNRIAQSTSLILCGKGGKFDGFVKTGDAMVENAKASLFLRQGNSAAIVIDMQATTLNVLNVDDSADAATGTDSGLISVEHDKQLYREYVRYLMSQNQPRSPAWLEEGLSQIIMKMQFDKRTIEFAKLEDPNTVSAQAGLNADLAAVSAAADSEAAISLPGAPAEDRDFAAALRRRALVPLDKFFAVKHDAPEATNPLGNNIWAKQAYALVHMCLYGHRGKLQKPFMNFLVRSAKEPVTEALFKECFNKTYKEMLLEIRSYCEFTVYEAKYLEAKKGQPDLITVPAALELREATQSEVGRIKGEAFVLAGHGKAARTEMIAPYLRGERDPNLLAALGLLEKNAGEADRARKLLEAAYAGKTTRADALLEVARIHFSDAVAKPAEAGGRFSAAQVAGVIEPLRLARRQPPPLPALYDLAGETWTRGAAPLKKEEVSLLIEGATQFPTRYKLVFQAAVAAGQAGELQAAHALADHGIKFVPDPNGKKRFQDLKASLPPAPAQPAAEASPAKDAGGKKQ